MKSYLKLAFTGLAACVVLGACGQVSKAHNNDAMADHYRYCQRAATHNLRTDYINEKSTSAYNKVFLKTRPEVLKERTMISCLATPSLNQGR